MERPLDAGTRRALSDLVRSGKKPSGRRNIARAEAATMYVNAAANPVPIKTTARARATTTTTMAAAVRYCWNWQ